MHVAADERPLLRAGLCGALRDINAGAMLGGCLHHWREKRRIKSMGRHPTISRQVPANSSRKCNRSVWWPKVKRKCRGTVLSHRSTRGVRVIGGKSHCRLFQRASLEGLGVSYTVQLATTATQRGRPAAATAGKSVSGILAAQLQPHESRGTDNDIAADALQWK